MHEGSTFTNGYQISVLVVATVLKCHYAVMGSFLAVTQFKHLGFDMNRVAVEQRLGKTHLVPAQIGHGGAQGGVSHGHADDQPQREHTVDDALAKFRMVLTIVFVQMKCGGIVGECRKQHVIHLGHGAPYGVLKHLTDKKFFKIQGYIRY